MPAGLDASWRRAQCLLREWDGSKDHGIRHHFWLPACARRDMELAKFEAFLKKQAAKDIKVTVRGKQRLAYPIKKCVGGWEWEGRRREAATFVGN